MPAPRAIAGPSVANGRQADSTRVLQAGLMLAVAALVVVAAWRGDLPIGSAALLPTATALVFLALARLAGLVDERTFDGLLRIFRFGPSLRPRVLLWFALAVAVWVGAYAVQGQIIALLG